MVAARRPLVLICAALWLALAGCAGAEKPAPPPPAAADSPASAAPAAGPPGSISGRVTFAGAVPKRSPIPASKDKEICGAHPILPEDLMVGAEGGVQNAVVEIIGAPKRAGVGAGTPEIHQQGCVFHPHLSVIPAGVPIAVFNDDGALHNIHTFSSLNPLINRAQPKHLKRLEVQFDQAETIKVSCDVHPWMSAWLVVTDHPFITVSNAAGAFRIGALPAGSYLARVWHEKLGERTQPVVIAAGQEAALSVEFR